MARKKTENTLLAEIREVINDYNNNFHIKCHDDLGNNVNNGDLDPLREEYVVRIVEDLLSGNHGTLTRDYLKTKRAAVRATAKAAAAP